MSHCGKAQFKLPGATDIPLCSGEILLIGRPSVFECEFREMIEQDRPGFTERVIRNIQSYASHGAGRLHEILWDVDGVGNGPLSTRGICERIVGLVRRGTLLAFVIPAVSQCDIVTEKSQLEDMSSDLPDANLVNANIRIEGVSFAELKSFQDRLVYVVRKSGDYFTTESFKEAFKNAMTATVVISTVVVLAFWAASHFVGGVGFAIDAILIAIGWAMIGWGIFSAMRSLLNCLKKTKNATSMAELDEAAKELADTLTQVGIDLLIGLLTRGAGKLRVKVSAKPESGGGAGGAGKSKAEIEAGNKAKAEPKKKSLKDTPADQLDFKTVMDGIDDLDVSTKAGTSVFYSGRGAREAAEKVAIAQKKTTLEQTPGGKILDDMKLFEDTVPDIKGDEAMQAWMKISSKYAEGSSGKVTAIINNPRPNSVFLSKELPALLKNKNVTEVFVQTTSGASVSIPSGSSMSNALKLIGGL